MKKLFSKKMYLLCALAFMALHSVCAQITEKVYLSGHGIDDTVEWDFYCTKGRNSGKWGKIAVPSNWELQGYGTYNYGLDEEKADEQGIYRTTFVADKAWRKNRVQVVFEGSMTDTQVKLNGRQIGAIHQGSFYCFKRDLTKYLKYGKENTLEVTVSKKSSNYTVDQAERQADFWVFGGIFRPVYLEITPKVHIASTAFDAKHDGSLQADIHINKAIKNASVLVEIRDKNEKLVGTCAADAGKARMAKVHVKGQFDGVKPWSTEAPNLYTATIVLKERGKELHRINQRIGFRTIEVRAQDGIYLNNQKIKFKGVNRHCFWPETGRATSKALSIRDGVLIKEMNMNAVRMAHYPPDAHFLEVCDSLGLMVIDELCAWHPPAYDTQVGTILVNEMLQHDVNHPSIVLWANGNEGGFNRELLPLYHEYDLQKREVLHPWAWSWHHTINTLHYINYDEGVGNMFGARDIFFPTECLHGLYDGGHGAGLDDFWKRMKEIPNSAGLFLWVLTDEGLVRTDRNGAIDTDGDHAPDGILGSYREKEGSYYTIRNIWSPIQILPFNVTPKWNNECMIENNYMFTSLGDCHLEYELHSVSKLSGDMQMVSAGKIALPEVAPQETKRLKLGIPEVWKEADILTLKVYDYENKHISTWTYDITQPAGFAARELPLKGEAIAASNEADCVVWKTDRLNISISKKDGTLKKVVADGEEIPLANGPFLVHPLAQGEPEVYVSPKADTVRVKIMQQKKKKKFLFSFTWTMNQEGILTLDYDYALPGEAELSGVSFDYPEKQIEGADLMARGPYRVYKNRLRGPNLGLWHKEYNNTVTGETFIYPEFKGYYSDFYAARFQAKKPFEIYSGTTDMFLHLFSPDKPVGKQVRTHRIHPKYPKKNISFMNAIPAIGTKFKETNELGPQSMNSFARDRWDAGTVVNKLYFKF